jgi:hypothetical protein
MSQTDPWSALRKGAEFDAALIQVVHKPDGWYVFNGELIGPFYARKSATDLAVGLVEALRDTGQAASWQMVEEIAPPTSPS